MNSEQNIQIESKETWYSYVILAVSFFSCFVTDGLEASYGVIFQDLKSYFSADAFRLSLPLAILDFILHVAALFTSAFVKVFGLRAAGFIGGLVSAGGFVIAYFAPSLEVFTVAYGVAVGIGFGFLYVSSGVAIQIFFDKRRSVATGVYYSGSALGMFAMSPLVRYLSNTYSWRGCMLIEAGIVLQCIWLWLLVHPVVTNRIDEEQNQIHETKNQTNSKDHHTEVTSSFSCNILDVKPCISEKLITTLKESFDFKLMKKLQFIFYLLALFIAHLGFPVTYTFTPDKGTDMGFSYDDTKWFVSFTGIGGLIGRITFGVIGNFSIFIGRRLYLQILTVGLTGACLLLVPICESLWSIYAILTMYGFASGGHVVMTLLVLYDLFGSDVITRSFGLSLVIIGVACLVTTPLMGFVRDRNLTYDPVFFLAGGCFILSMFVMLLIPVSRQGDKTRGEYLELH